MANMEVAINLPTIDQPDRTCLRVVLEESVRPDLGPINEAIIGDELNAALGFEIHTPTKDIARFDCQKVGCTATCEVVSIAIPRLSPRMETGSQWLTGCIDPES